ncbi:MAG: hypothetical protein GY869_09350 [Planctomycetes bacterium]|nr:hypothetical protein [Planctomycetota bacterium]
MKNLRLSDETFDQLKDFVVDPFDDTPEVVINRLIDIVNKAKSRWSPLDRYAKKDESSPQLNRENVDEAVKVL